MIDRYPTLLFFGPPGSGKGTQAKFLSQLTGHYHLSAGDIFRSISKESRFGQSMRECSEKGLLIPDQMATEIWRDHTANLVKKGLYRPENQLLFADGMPRTVEQALLLKDCLFVKGVIFLEIDDQDCLIDRLTARADLEDRDDDKDLKTLKTRLEVFTTQTKEVLQTFPQEIIIAVSAKQRPFEVTRDILNQTGELFKYPLP